jgi:adsorption protein B
MPRRWLQAWFFWRDRKVLWGSWLGLMSNAVFLWALAGWAAAKAAGAPWWLGESVSRHPWLGLILTTNLALCVERLAVRMYCTGRIYGWLFAAAAPVRMVWGNLINAAASAGAVWQFARSLWTGQPLRWLKTEHCYPSLESLQPAEAIPNARAAAAASAAAGPVAPAPVPEWRGSARRPAAGVIRAMAPANPGMSGPELATKGAVDRRILRALPAELCGQWLVAPLRVVDGCMEIASAGELSPAAMRQIARQAGLPVRFLDVSPDAVRQLLKQRDAVPRQPFLERQTAGASHAAPLPGRGYGEARRRPGA